MDDPHSASDLNLRVYLLDSKSLSPETIAVTFAKTSRSPESFRQIAAELTDERSAEFNEKWVVGYGHASVAEHAVLHIAIENVSRLAVECIESNRLASYTEKSTRYQKWNPESYFIPLELEGSPLRNVYIDTCHLLMDTYQQAMDTLKLHLEQNCPQLEGETRGAYERRLRSQNTDVCRFLLPAACLANLGMTANARVLEHAICKMLSHPLMEVRAVGEEIKRTALAELPSLVKYACRTPYLVDTTASLAAEASRHDNETSALSDWCTLSTWDGDGEVRILAAALYRFSSMSYDQAYEYVLRMSEPDRPALADKLLRQLGEFDIPLRELEYTNYIFDMILDQGAYFEVKRHRMMTQTPQVLTVKHGYAVPKLIVDAGFEGKYRQAMDAARNAFLQLEQFNPAVAAYIVPNGYNRRLLLSMNLRSAYHFCKLRSTPRAHFSVRRVALRMAELIRSVHPALAAYMRLPANETWQSVQAEYFNQV
jgi:thymidylate synthase ThyX